MLEVCRPWPEQRLEPGLRIAQSSAGAPGLLLDSLACCNDTGVGSPADQVSAVPLCASMECGRGRVIRSAAFVIVSPTPGVFADRDHAKLRSKITCAIQPRKTTQHTDSHQTCRDRQHRPRAGWASQILAATCRISGRTHTTYTTSRNRERPLRPVYLFINGLPHAFCG